MISITKLTLFMGAAALLVSAGPTTLPEVDRSVLAAVPAYPEDDAFDVRSITSTDDPRLQKRNGQLYCGAFASAEYFDAHDLVHDIREHSGVQHTIGAHGCLRVECKNTSGVYVCNDRNSPLTISGGEIVKHTEPILCCIHNKSGAADFQKQSGGQQFTDALGGGWNVIIGYANCNHPLTRPPSSYNGGTVNGDGCRVANMFID